MTTIAPSLLAADFLHLEGELGSLEKAGADWLHIDVMDGHFVKNLSFGLPIISAIKGKTTLFLDVHLMISNPEEYIDEYVDAGAESITFHYETLLTGSYSEDEKKLNKLIKKVKERNVKVGVAIKPGTEIDSLLEKYLGLIDMLLIMTVEPGFGGQSFILASLEKIKQADKLRKKRGFSFLIQVDGGINLETGEKCVESGADVLVSGSSLFSYPNRSDYVSNLKKK